MVSRFVGYDETGFETISLQLTDHADGGARPEARQLICDLRGCKPLKEWLLR